MRRGTFAQCVILNDAGAGTVRGSGGDFCVRVEFDRAIFRFEQSDGLYRNAYIVAVPDGASVGKFGGVLTGLRANGYGLASSSAFVVSAGLVARRYLVIRSGRGPKWVRGRPRVRFVAGDSAESVMPLGSTIILARSRGFA